MVVPFLIAGAGGFLGTMLRYALSLAGQHFSITFPHGTLWANLLGCLTLGTVMGLAAETEVLAPSTRLFLATGLCGGFTTMSSFTYETVRLIQDGEWLYAVTYWLATLIGCTAALCAGLLVVKGIVRIL